MPDKRTMQGWVSHYEKADPYSRESAQVVECDGKNGGPKKLRFSAEDRIRDSARKLPIAGTIVLLTWVGDMWRGSVACAAPAVGSPRID